jgi:DNA (cytosine-5)-methyltransferase 1
MLYGLDLFSGIGGITRALMPWVRPMAYVECDQYAQHVLLSRMRDKSLPSAPIWDDVRTLRREHLDVPIDCVYGGFPCQDISVAGTGEGLAGKRSGLVFEVLRLVEELQPSFVFLENVPAIRTRGEERVVKELASRGYDCRWDNLSAEDVGAPHRRTRWWLLAANARSIGTGDKQQEKGSGRELGQGRDESSDYGEKESLAYAHSSRLKEREFEFAERTKLARTEFSSWWEAESDVCRVVDELPHRVDRTRCLGNAVVPAQAREAFIRLMGL